MRNIKPRFEAAECSAAHCEDPQCPYIHFDAWEVNGVYFRTLAEAEAAAQCPQVRETPHE